MELYGSSKIIKVSAVSSIEHLLRSDPRPTSSGCIGRLGSSGAVEAIGPGPKALPEVDSRVKGQHASKLKAAGVDSQGRAHIGNRARDELWTAY